MEAILNKRKQKLIEEGLNIIDSWEEYIEKNNPETYKKYLDLKEEELINYSDKWTISIQLLKNIKYELNFRKENFDLDMFTEIENYINTFKPKVSLERDNICQINNIANIINNISKIPDQSRFNYYLKCSTFLNIEHKLLDIKKILD